MTKRFGTKRGQGCECTVRFTCRACFVAASPTLDNSAPRVPYRTGDGRTFANFARASAHVSEVSRDTGVILGIEEV